MVSETMAVILRVYDGERLIDTDITDKASLTIGTGKRAEVPLLSISKGQIRFKKKKDGWNYETGLKFQNRASKGVMVPEEFLVEKEKNFAFLIYETDYNQMKTISLSGQDQLLIGRGENCQIRLDSRNISRSHANLRRTEEGWELLDCSSSGETYVNGRKVKRVLLKTGDEVDIGLCHMIFSRKELSLRFKGACILSLKSRQEVRTGRPGEEYPYLFSPSPRFLKKAEEETVDIEKAPAIGNSPKMNWFSVFMPPVLSMGIMALMSAVMGFSSYSIMYSLPMTMVGIIMSVFNYRSQKKEFKRLGKARDTQYKDYLESIEENIKEKQHHQRQILLETHPSPEGCIRLVRQMGRNLWNRCPSDSDFMTLRLGTGEIPSCIRLKVPKEALSLEKDEFLEKGRKLAAVYQMTKDCPVTLDLFTVGTCGFTGKREDILKAGKNLVMQAAAHHSYGDLNIITICRSEEWDQWSWIRWLPHSFNETRTGRRIVIDENTAEEVLPGLIDELQTAGHPFLLFLCTDAELTSRFGLLKLLGKLGTQTGVGALFFFERVERLPKECAAIVEIKGRNGAVYCLENAEDKQKFVCDSCSEEMFEEFARAMAPVRLDMEKNSQLPLTVTFLEGYGIRRPSELDLEARWQEGRPEKSMAVPIGVRAGGDAFFFDMNEKKHGPHGLVAGTTGSGKSEMVQSWILSMALQFSPQQVSFVLIDFKGTGLILPFKNLPHLAGTISDLDKNIGRNLIALEKELERRKTIFDQYQVQNIRDYYRLYREGKAREPLSYLFVVIDEFAEFKLQFPEFMDVVNRIFGTGRTLGVSILLLTQKPSGVVTDKMTANTRFRWCLKVASSSDSMDMLGCKDAARITNAGRAIVQVGENEIFETIQGYWSGAPYRPVRKENSPEAENIAMVDILGKRISYEAEKTTGYRAEKNEIDAVVEYLDTYVRENEVLRARNIWTQKMESEIYLNQVLTIAFDGEKWKEEEGGLRTAIGQVDDPRAQAQYPLMLDMERDGNLAVYGSVGSGKTTILQTMILSLSLSYSPENLWMYMMDFGGGNLLLFKNLPHVGDIAVADDEEKMEKIMDFFQSELAGRKALFSAAGARNLPVYRELTGTNLPYIVLFLDNFAPVLSLYPKMEDFFQTLVRDSSSYGIYWIVTANSQSALSYRLSQHFRSGLALQMNDAMDYSGIVGRTGGLLPENTPGRGLMKGTPPLEFQAALPMHGNTEGEKLENLRQLIELMNQKWSGIRPKVMAVMPEHVTLSQIIRAEEEIGLGLRYGSLAPVLLKPENRPFLMIAERGSQNRYQLMDLILRQLAVQDTEEILLCDVKGSLEGFPAASSYSYMKKPEEFDDAMERIMAVMQQRKEEKEGNPKCRFPLLVFAIADYRACMEQVNEETKRRLKLLVTLGKELGIFYVIMMSAEELGMFMSERDTGVRSFINACSAVLIGGCGRDYSGFYLNLSYKEEGNVLESGSAYFYQMEGTEKIKYIEG